MALAGLRRATASDLAAVTALQQAAYARNRDILGVEPLPLTADYTEILAAYEVWLAATRAGLEGVLILMPRAGDLLIWSVATTPAAQGQGVGTRLLDAAETRARELGKRTLRLYTGENLAENIAWYERHGYRHERLEERGDRRLIHLVKQLRG